MPPDIILFIIALASLIIAGRLVITFITKAATAFGVSEFALAFILLAVATSIPELFVSIASARQGAGELVLAVTLGSNIINATLVIGLAAFLSVGISTTGLKPRRDIFFTASVTLLPLLFLSDGLISSFEGLLLLVAFGYYILLIYRDQQRVSARLAPRLTSGLGNSILALIMLAALIYAADKTVGSAVSIAHTLNIPPFLIGILALALGTSLPELTTAIRAALMRKPGLALGNIIGSNVANSTLVIGAASSVRPLVVDLTLPLITTALFALIAVVVLAFFVTSRKRLSAKEGLLLILLFLVFVTTTIFTA